MAETPRDPPSDEPIPVPGIDLYVRPDPTARAEEPATTESGEMLEKLEALLGRLRGPETPAEQPPGRMEIPTLDQPVHWTSPAANLQAIPAGGHIPTLTETVELQPALLSASPAPAAPGLAAAAAPPELATPRAIAAAPVSFAVAAPSAEPDPTRRQELRERVESLIDPDLEQRLCERAMADLDRTLIDIEHGFRDELTVWRDEQLTLMRDQVRSEIERAVDEVVAELARQRGPASR